MGESFSCTLGYLDPRIVSMVEHRIRSAKILVVSKTTCPACARAKQLLRGLVSKTGVNPTIIEVDQYENQCTKGVMNYLSAQTGISTVPQIYINGRFVGGNDVIQRLHKKGKLVQLILQPMKASPSIASATDVNRYGYMSSTSTARPLRVSAFKRKGRAIPSFEKPMPANTTIPRTNNDIKSDYFNDWKSNTQTLSLSRRWSTTAVRPLLTPKLDIFNDSHSQSSFRSTDLEILSKPTRVRSMSSSSWPQPWREARPILKSIESWNNAQISSGTSFPIQPSNQSSWIRPARDRPNIKTQWLPNSIKEIPITTIATIATPSRRSIVNETPTSRGKPSWMYINPKVV